MRSFFRSDYGRYALRFLAIVLALLFFGKVVVYLLISFLITLSLGSVYYFLRDARFRHRVMPPSLAALLTLAFLIVVVFSVITFLIPLFVSQYEALSGIDFTAMKREVSPSVEVVAAWLERYKLLDLEGVSLEQTVVDRLKDLIHLIDLTDVINGLLSTVGDMASGFFSVCFIVFFFLKDGSSIERTLFHFFVAKRHYLKGKRLTRGVKGVLIRYFTGVLIQVSAITCLISVALYILGVPNAFALGFMVGMLNVVPYVGPLIGGLVVVLMTGLNHISMFGLDGGLGALVLKIVVVIGGTQLLDNVLFQPLIFSKSTRLHPLEVFLIVLCGSGLAGILGMVVAVPAYSVSKMVIQVVYGKNRQRVSS